MPLGQLLVLYHFRYLSKGTFPFIDAFRSVFVLYHFCYLQEGAFPDINTFRAFVHFTISAISQRELSPLLMPLGLLSMFSHFTNLWGIDGQKAIETNEVKAIRRAKRAGIFLGVFMVKSNENKGK